MKNNTYFEELERIGCEWQKKYDAHKALKDRILEEHGWDSPELKAWYAEEEKMKGPFPSGVSKAFRAWKYGESDEFLFEDFVWEREADDFIDTLRKAGLETFVVTNDSTALMENIHWFVGLGCKLEGTCIVTKHRRRWGEDEEEQLMGLRFSL